MTKYIKDKDGKFAGSIGDGKNKVPTTPPTPPARRERIKPDLPETVSIEEQWERYQRHFFSADGSYGDANALTVIDTTDWTSDDWDAIDEASDYERLLLARQIASRKGNAD